MKAWTIYDMFLFDMTDTWLTPPHILEALGPFDLDPCTPPDMPWETAAHRYSCPQDGLALPWFGRVWLNPPYGRATGHWLGRLEEHGQGTALIFARTDTSWFFKRIWGVADALLFLRGRLFFHLPDGSRSEYSGGAPSVLAAYGRDDMDRLAASGLDGAFVPLPNRTQVLILGERSWLAELKTLFRQSGQELDLQAVYELMQHHPKSKKNQHWQAKIRQVLQRGLHFTRVSRGVYRLN